MKLIFFRSWDSSVGNATGYGLDGRGSIHVGGKKCSLLHVVQTGFGTDPASYQMGTGTLRPGLNWSESEADHSLLVPRSRMVELYFHSPDVLMA
jgi:hypothetical protein